MTDYQKLVDQAAENTRREMKAFLDDLAAHPEWRQLSLEEVEKRRASINREH